MLARPLQLLQVLRQAAWISAGLAVLLGTVVLAGWAFDVPTLKEVFSGEPAVQPVTAVLLVSTGVAAWLLGSTRTSTRVRGAAHLLGVLVAAFALLLLLEHLAVIDLGLDKLPLSRARGPGTAPRPHQMASTCALSFFFLGCALSTYDRATRHWLGFPSQGLALVALLAPLHGFIAWIYGVRLPGGVASHFQLPLPVGVGLALLCTALILDRPGSGILRVFVQSGLAGSMARSIAAVSVILPIVLGWLFLIAELRLSQDQSVLGVSLVVIGAIVLGGAVVWLTVTTLAHAELERTRAQATEKDQRERLRTTLASIGDGVVAADVMGRVTLVNAVAEVLTGWSEADAKGRLLGEVLPTLLAPTGDRIDPLGGQIFRKAEVMPLPPRAMLRARDGRERPVEGSAAPLRDENGVIRGAVIVFRDITSQRQLEEERVELLESEQMARADAERASRAKDEFIATVSHELRTPLNAVLGWARLLRLGKLDDSATARAIEAIERNAHTQAQIVDDLLDVSRIVRGELRLDVRAVDLTSIIEAAIETMRPAAQARNTTITASLEPKTGLVSGDPGRLQQAIWNLLSNAIKFTPPGGQVEVRLDRCGENVNVQVSDTGVGIDPAFAPHLFQRFRQADSSSTRAHGGLGIGLAIVRHLVEAHGGSVSAQSDGPGKGAAFTISLPSSTGRPRLSVPQSRHARPAEEEPLPAVPSLRSLRVLVVDDDGDTLDVVKELLEQAGAEVVAAASAAEALRELRARPPDVLLSDIGMPGEDGYALIRKVRSLAPAEGGTVPAAALTAYTQTEDRRQVLEAGYQEYLSKPIDPAELAAAVARLAKRRTESSSGEAPTGSN